MRFDGRIRFEFLGSFKNSLEKLSQSESQKFHSAYRSLSEGRKSLNSILRFERLTLLIERFRTTSIQTRGLLRQIRLKIKFLGDIVFARNKIKF